MDAKLPLSLTHEVRDRCLCLHLQRAARAVARRFDDALAAVGLTNGQFSLLVALNRPELPVITTLAHFLAMDRTTVTAALKPLCRRGLVEIRVDAKDRRNHRPVLTERGRELLARAVPIWRRTHDALDQAMTGVQQPDLRGQLFELATSGRN
jgi:DNA-binding MarR family transcriptional regulator